MTFTGFPKEALDFYDDLELDNTKSYWTAHRDVYETCVKAPMIELTGALEEEFGPAKVYRPYRDVRFSKDKTPYKDHQGAYVASSTGSGWYVQISAAGVFVAVGYYDPAPGDARRDQKGDRGRSQRDEPVETIGRPGAQGLDARWCDAQDEAAGVRR